MLRRLGAICLLVIGATAFAVAQPGNRVSDYLYFSEYEQTENQEIIWFWSEDEMFGPVRTNDTFAIKGYPEFHGEVFNHGSEFIQGSTYGPHFDVEPVMDAPYLGDSDFIHLVERTATAAQSGGYYFGNEDPLLDTRIEATSEGWHIWRWPTGVPFDSTEEYSFENVLPYGIFVLFVDGPLQMVGNHVSGAATIGCSGDMRFPDDVRYAEAYHPYSPSYPRLPYTNRLTLVTGGNFVIENTVANGRGNGSENSSNDQRDIFLTAQLVAPHGGLTFENQNNAPDDPNGWDGYYWCNPDGEHAGELDERGNLYLNGSLAIQRRHYVHRSNCRGTGYLKRYCYDQRFAGSRFQSYSQDYILDVRQESITWSDTTITFDSQSSPIYLMGENPLILGPGTTIVVDETFAASKSLFSGTNLAIEGEAGNPVRILVSDEIEGFNIFAANNGDIRGTWHDFVLEAPDLELMVPDTMRNFTIRSQNTYMNNRWRMNIEGMRVQGKVFLDCEFGPIVHSSLIEGTLEAQSLASIDRCTFVQRDEYSEIEDAIIVHNPATGYHPGGVLVRNTVFYGEYEGLIQSSTPSQVDYSAWYGMTDSEQLFSDSVDVLEHTLPFTDPLFWNPDGGDYHLMAGSPLINAGSHDAPRDPDGSRADIGAFPYDPTWTEAPEVDEESGLPMAFGIETLYPNPFNGMTTISLTLPFTRQVNVAVFDVLGRELLQVHKGVMQAGRKNLSINLAQQPSGLYFIVAQAGANRSVAKAMLVK